MITKLDDRYSDVLEIAGTHGLMDEVLEWDDSFHVSKELAERKKAFQDYIPAINLLEKRDQDVTRHLCKNAWDIAGYMEHLERLSGNMDKIVQFYQKNGADDDFLAGLYEFQFELSDTYDQYSDAFQYASAQVGIMVKDARAVSNLSEYDPDRSRRAWEQVIPNIFDSLPYNTSDIERMAEHTGVKWLDEIPMNINGDYEKADMAPYLNAIGKSQGREKIEYNDLTEGQRKFASQTFDKTFNSCVFSQNNKDELEIHGLDIFDQIFVDGKSLNDLYEKKYEGMGYYYAMDAMKCEFMADLASGKRIDVVRQGSEMAVPLDLSSTIPEFSQAVSAQSVNTSDFSAGIAESMERAANMSKREREEKTVRMQDKTPVYKDLPVLEYPFALYTPSIHHMSEYEARNQYGIRNHKGSFLAADKDNDKAIQEKESFLNFGKSEFRYLCLNMDLDIDHRLYQDAGITKASDLFYIDGMQADDFVVQKYQAMNIDVRSNPDFQRILETEITKAVYGNEHHVEAARVGMDKSGGFVAGVTEVRGDVRGFDSMAHFYEKKPSKAMDAFVKNDIGRQQREDKIRGEFSLKVAQAATKELNRQAAERNPHVKDLKKYNFDQPERTREYFSNEDMERIAASPYPESSDFKRSNYGGFRMLAQMYLLAEHPELHMSDLMDEDKYSALKRQAGHDVATAMTKYYAGPSKEGDTAYMEDAIAITKKAIGYYADLDLRSDLLHALGKDGLSNQKEIEKVLNAPENQSVVDNILRVYSGVSVKSFQMLGNIDPNHKKVHVGTMDPEKDSITSPFYIRLHEVMGPELQEKYRITNSVTRAFNGEKNLTEGRANMILGGFQEDSPSKRDDALKAANAYVVMNRYKAQIIDYGKPADFPQGEKSGDLGIYLQKEVQAKFAGRSAYQIASDVMNNNIPQDECDRMIADARVAALLDPERYDLGDNSSASASEYEDITAKTNIATLNRGPSRTGLANLYIIGTMGKSAEEFVNEHLLASGDTAMEAGRAVRNMLNENPYNGESEERKEQSAKAYADFYKKAGKALMEQPMPVADINDMTALRRIQPYIAFIGQAAIDFNQSKEKMMKEEHFLHNFGSAEEIDIMDGRADVVAEYSKFVQEITGNLVPMQQKFGDKLALIKYGPEIMGHKASEIDNAANLAFDMNSYASIVSSWALMGGPELEKQIEDYMNGRGPQPDISEIENTFQAARDARLSKQAQNKLVKQEENKTLRQNFFRSGDKELYQDIRDNTQVATMERVATRNSVARMFTMAEDGLSIEEVSRLSEEQSFAVGDRLLAMFHDHPNKESMTPEEQKAANTFYGEFYKKSAEAILKESLPDMDPGKLYKTAESFEKMKDLAGVANEYYQSQPNLSKNPDFIAAMGGEEKHKEYENKINFIGKVAQAGVTMLSDEEVVHRFASKALFDKFVPMITGKPFSEIQITERDLMEMESYEAAINLWADAHENDRRSYVSMKGYSEGSKKLPVMESFSELLDMNREIRGLTDEPVVEEKLPEGKVAETAVEKPQERMAAVGHPYEVAHKRYAMGNDITEQYITPELQARIDELPTVEMGLTEMKRGGSGGFRTYSQFLLKQRYPDIRIADLTDPSKYQEEKLQAASDMVDIFVNYRKEVKDGVRGEYTKQMAGVMESGIDMLYNMDVRKELLYALGKDPSMTDASEIRDIFHAPENQAEVNGFLSGLQGFVIKSEQSLQKIDTKMVQYNSLSEKNVDSYSPAYRELLEKVGEDHLKDFYNTTRGLKGLAAEDHLYKGLATYRDESVQAENRGTIVDPYAFCYAMRDVIASHGPAHEYPGALMENFRSWSGMSRDGEEEFEKTGQKVEMADIESGFVNEDFIYSYIGRKQIETMADYGQYYNEDNNAKCEEMGNRSGLKNFGHPEVRTSLGMMSQLAEGASLSQIADIGAVAKRNEAGTRVMNMLKDNVYDFGKEHSLEISAQKTRTAEVFGDFYQSAATGYLQQTMPEINLNDPVSMARDSYVSLNILRNVARDYRTSRENLEQNNGFIRAFGSKEVMDRANRVIDSAGKIADCAIAAIDPRATLDQQISSRMMLNSFGSIFSGKDLGTIQISEAVYSEMREFSRNTSDMLKGMTEEDKLKLRDQLKEEPGKVLQAEEKTPVEKEKPQVKQIDFNTLAQKDAKTDTRKLSGAEKRQAARALEDEKTKTTTIRTKGK